jgi:type I restriction enzyme, R subunit
MVDEAHRTQYGIDAKYDVATGEQKYGYAKYLRAALPNATFIAFTGTPIETTDKSTSGLFGDVIDVYDMTQAVQDGATVKIYYESRLAKVKLDEKQMTEIDKEYWKMQVNGGVDDYTVEQSQKQLHNCFLKISIPTEFLYSILKTTGGSIQLNYKSIISEKGQ